MRRSIWNINIFPGHLTPFPVPGVRHLTRFDPKNRGMGHSTITRNVGNVRTAYTAANSIDLIDLFDLLCFEILIVLFEVLRTSCFFQFCCYDFYYVTQKMAMGVGHLNRLWGLGEGGLEGGGMLMFQIDRRIILMMHSAWGCEKGRCPNSFAFGPRLFSWVSGNQPNQIEKKNVSHIGIMKSWQINSRYKPLELRRWMKNLFLIFPAPRIKPSTLQCRFQSTTPYHSAIELGLGNTLHKCWI